MKPHGIHSPLKITFYFSEVYISKYFIAKDSYCKCHSKIREIPEVAHRRLFYILITYVPQLYVMYLLLILRDIYKELLSNLLWDPWKEWIPRGHCTRKNKFASNFSGLATNIESQRY